MKIYIDNFVEDLNYRKVILYIGNVDSDTLCSRMDKDYVNHMNRFDSVLENNLMFIENCDLQDVDTDYGDELGNSLLYLISEGYAVYLLQYDETTKRYLVDTGIK